MRFLIVMALAWFSGSVWAQSARLVNSVVAVVDDSVITETDVQKRLYQLVDSLRNQYRTQPQLFQQRLMELRADIIDQLVQRKLILKDFGTAGFNLPETFLEDQVREEIRNRFGDRVTLTKTLQAQGVTYENFRQEIRDDIIVQFLQQKNVSGELFISPAKIEVYYQKNQEQYRVGDQVKLRMIIIDKTKHPNGEARQLAEKVLAELDAGKPFAELADLHSEAKQRSAGGDRGWVEKSDSNLRKELADVAFTLEPGKNSGVIETEDSCFLLRVEDRKIAHVRSLSEAREDIEKNLRLQERARLQKGYVERLKKKCFVAYF